MASGVFTCRDVSVWGDFGRFSGLRNGCVMIAWWRGHDVVVA